MVGTSGFRKNGNAFSIYGRDRFPGKFISDII
jgi:hypothetical protein